jgi:chitinase
MGYHTNKLVIVVPAAKLAAFNDAMARHGYGGNMLVARDDNACVGAADDAKAKAATHYFLATIADAGLVAAAKMVLQKINLGLPAKEKGAASATPIGKNKSGVVDKTLESLGVKPKDGKAKDGIDKAKI